MVILHIRQWRQVPGSVAAVPGNTSPWTTERLSQKASGILGETLTTQGAVKRNGPLRQQVCHQSCLR